jgi:hypothetical protein
VSIAKHDSLIRGFFSCVLRFVYFASGPKHAATARGATLSQHNRRFFLCGFVSLWRHHGEQRAHSGEIIRASAAGEKPVMADAVQDFRQDKG